MYKATIKVSKKSFFFDNKITNLFRNREYFLGITIVSGR
jgi:hypothetical protein